MSFETLERDRIVQTWRLEMEIFPGISPEQDKNIRTNMARTMANIIAVYWPESKYLVDFPKLLEMAITTRWIKGRKTYVLEKTWRQLSSDLMPDGYHEGSPMWAGDGRRR